MREFREASRSLTSVLAPLEKRTLVFMAKRLPAAVNSDHLTALAFVAMLLAGLSYCLARLTPAGLLLAIVCLAMNWFGDSLDWTLARVRQQQWPRYGFYVDHVVDAAGAAFLFGGLGLSGYMSPLVALVLLAEIFGRKYRLLDVSGVIATVGMLCTLTVSVVKHTRALYRADPLPQRKVA